jgi:hypothetical protein
MNNHGARTSRAFSRRQALGVGSWAAGTLVGNAAVNIAMGEIGTR